MTLVVGRIVGSRVAIAADTLLTEHRKPLPFQEGVVKSCMLPGDICVSFSNSPASAAAAFKKFATRYPRGSRFAEVITFFEKSSSSTGNDYLIAFANPARLVKIADGKRAVSLYKTLWIGDHEAFVRFREYEAEVQRKPEQGRAVNAVYFADELKNSPASDLFSIMRNVVVDRGITSAGGFVSVISNRDSGFRFSVYSDMLFDWPKNKSEDFNLSLADRITLGSSLENADYAVAQISPGYMGVNVVGFYFNKAKKLFFFFGDENGLATKCTVFSDITASIIKDVLNNFVRADLNWLLTITSPKNREPTSEEISQIKEPGVAFSWIVEANTFSKS